MGKRSPRPHNDAQVYFSNTDPRWREATKPSDFPPLYAVADGIIELAQGNGSYYNVVDHSDSDPPWWHSAYLFKLQFAQNNGNVVSFLYQMEGYVIKDDMNFFKDYLLVENGQVVKKGDILGYMYVPTLEEMVGTMQGSSHIAFALMEKRGTSKEQKWHQQFLLKKLLNSFRIYTEIQKKVGRVQVMVTTGRGEEGSQVRWVGISDQKNIHLEESTWM